MTSPHRGLKDASNKQVPAWLCARWVWRYIHLRTYVHVNPHPQIQFRSSHQNLDNGSGTVIEADTSHRQPVSPGGGVL